MLITCCTIQKNRGNILLPTKKSAIKENNPVIRFLKTTGHEEKNQENLLQVPFLFLYRFRLLLSKLGIYTNKTHIHFYSPACAPLIRDSSWVFVCVSTTRLLFDRAQVVCFFVVRERERPGPCRKEEEEGNK